MQGDGTTRNRSVWYILLATGTGILALAGYAGYVLYPRFNLPAATGIGLLVLAAGAGIASFFSPCSFPLLVTLLARETSARAAPGESRLQRALTFAVALALGATAFLLLIGVGIALGASVLFEGVIFTSTAGRLVRLLVGGFLILLGLIQLGVLPVSFGLVEHAARPLLHRQAGLRRARPTLGFGLFGFGYILAGFG